MPLGGKKKTEKVHCSELDREWSWRSGRKGGQELFPPQFSLLYLNHCPQTKSLGLGKARVRQRVCVCICVCKMDGLSAFLGVWVKLYSYTARGG